MRFLVVIEVSCYLGFFIVVAEIELTSQQKNDSFLQGKLRSIWGKPLFLGLPFYVWLIVCVLMLSCLIAIIVEYSRG